MQKTRLLIIVLIVFLGLAAFKTASPAAEASKECILGYQAYCSFTPVSTIILGLAAIGTFFATKNTVLGKTT